MPKAETTVVWRCDVCSTGYPTEAEALECENLPLEGSPFQIGDQFVNPLDVWRMWYDEAANLDPPIFTIAGSRVVLWVSGDRRCHATEHQLVCDTYEPFYKRGKTIKNKLIWVNPVQGAVDFVKPTNLLQHRWKWVQANLVKVRASRSDLPPIPTYRGPSPEERLIKAIFGEEAHIKDQRR